MNSKLLRVVKRYCPLCDKEHEVEERERLSSINIKGECVKYKEVYFECKETNEEENEFVSAKMHLNASLSIDDQNATTYYNYGNLLVDMKHTDEAIEMYKRAIELKKDFKEANDELEKLEEKEI